MAKKQYTNITCLAPFRGYETFAQSLLSISNDVVYLATDSQLVIWLWAIVENCSWCSFIEPFFPTIPHAKDSEAKYEVKYKPIHSPILSYLMGFTCTWLPSVFDTNSAVTALPTCLT